MSINFTHNRVLELETIILETLLPIYKRYYSDKDTMPPYSAVLLDLEKEIKSKHKIPALLKPPINVSNITNSELSFSY